MGNYPQKIGEAIEAEWLFGEQGRYAIEGAIGSGDMGTVFKAHDRKLDRDVAIKTLNLGIPGSNRYVLEALKMEIQQLKELKHSAIVSIYDGDIHDQPYYVMDYIDGTDLRRVINNRRDIGKPFSLAETVELLRPIAEALDYIHSREPQIIHRDIKPENILVPLDPKYQAKSLLTNFGISLSTDTNVPSTAILEAHTTTYVAPEYYDRLTGNPATLKQRGDAYTDNYSLAVVTYETLTLRKFQAVHGKETWKNNRTVPEVLLEGNPTADYKKSSIRHLTHKTQPTAMVAQLISLIASMI